MLHHLQGYKIKPKRLSCSEETVETFSCTQCQFTTCLIVRFIQHVKKHHSRTSEEKPFPVKCYKCKKCTFKTRSILFWCKHRKNECPVKRRKNENLNPEELNFPKQVKRVTYKYKLRSFRSKCSEVLKTHHKQHVTKSKWLECEQCDYKTYTKRNLIEHYYVHRKNNLCDLTSRRKDKFAAHIKTSTETEVANTKNSLEKRKWLRGDQCDCRTMKIKTEKEWFMCAHCSYKTENKYHVRVHFNRVHREGKWHTCEHCEYKSRRADRMKNHVKAVHTSASDKKWFRCEQCDFKSIWVSDLKVHVIAKHAAKMSNEWFMCDQCDYKTQVVHYFRRHVNKHGVNI